MVVTEITRVTDELLDAFERLVPQLSRSSPPPTRDRLVEIVSSTACKLFVAREPDHGGEIVGTLTLVVFSIPTGNRGWIEDVVVDADARGKGIGTALILTALERAAELGARTVDLTSRPSREAANRLYQRLGFAKRATNVYRYALDIA
jgi:ribosomal protein S18 acetylase RimI-like enzyme